MPEVGKLRRRLLLRFPPQGFLYTCSGSHVGDATSSLHTAAPLWVPPQEVLRVVAVWAGCMRAWCGGGGSGAMVWWYKGVQGVWGVWGRRRYTEKREVDHRIEIEV